MIMFMPNWHVGRRIVTLGVFSGIGLQFDVFVWNYVHLSLLFSHQTPLKHRFVGYSP